MLSRHCLASLFVEQRPITPSLLGSATLRACDGSAATVDITRRRLYALTTFYNAIRHLAGRPASRPLCTRRERIRPCVHMAQDFPISEHMRQILPPDARTKDCRPRSTLELSASGLGHRRRSRLRPTVRSWKSCAPASRLITVTVDTVLCWIFWRWERLLMRGRSARLRCTASRVSRASGTRLLRGS